MPASRITHNRFLRCREACELAMAYNTRVRAAKLSVIVGTLLILINQWEVLFGVSAINWLKVALTYIVPYLVTTYTSVSKDLQMRREAEAAEQWVHQEAEEARLQNRSV